MTAQAASLTDEQIQDIAAYVTEAPESADDPHVVPTGDPKKGEQLAQACTACHGPGRSADAPIAPTLAGQGRAYLENQLTVWRDEPRGGGPRTELMRKAAQGLTDAQIKTLAAWYAGLAPD